MIVTEDAAHEIITSLVHSSRVHYGVDCETTGLLEHDSLFSLIISGDEDYYFSFNDAQEHALPRAAIFHLLKDFFAREDLTFFMANAKFDLRMLAKEGIEVAGTVHDCAAVERVMHNNLIKGYSLAEMAKRRGWQKDDAVAEYISKHKCYTNIEVPGKKKII